MLRDTAQETLLVDWSKFYARSASRSLVAIAVPLLALTLAGYPRAAVMVTAGAMTVGLGSFQEVRKSRALPMLLAGAGICLSSWIGTLAGQSTPATILTCALWGFLYASLSQMGPGIAWIAMQCVIWLVISTAYPANGLHALLRGSLALAGGLLQTVVSWLLWRASILLPPPSVGAADREESFANLVQILRAAPRYQFAVRAFLVMGLAAAFYRASAYANGYWIPVTAVIVMRPQLHQTVQRGVARFAGTLLGAALATVLVAFTHPRHSLLALFVVIFSWLAYALRFVNYAVFAACITAYVVFVLSLVGLPGHDVILHRILSTVIGGALALTTNLLFSRLLPKLPSPPA